MEADALGANQRAGRRKPTKKATPPNDGVGRMCHRSSVGRVTHPQRMAKWRTRGTRSKVSKKAQPGASTRRRPSGISRFLTPLTPRARRVTLKNAMGVRSRPAVCRQAYIGLRNLECRTVPLSGPFAQMTPAEGCEPPTPLRQTLYWLSCTVHARPVPFIPAIPHTAASYSTLEVTSALGYQCAALWSSASVHLCPGSAIVRLIGLVVIRRGSLANVHPIEDRP
jgi:hypothetical protein